MLAVGSPVHYTMESTIPENQEPSCVSYVDNRLRYSRASYDIPLRFILSFSLKKQVKNSRLLVLVLVVKS